MKPGCTIWLTGPPAAGKTTIARHVEQALRERGVPVENLDSDEVRQAISPNLGYTAEARDENTKRLAYVAKLLGRNGVVCLVACVSSRRAHRERARAWNPRFLEVHVTAPLHVLRARDPKGLYARADRGEVQDIAGVHQPYEMPEAPEVRCATDAEPPEESARRVLTALEARGWVPPAPRP